MDRDRENIEVKTKNKTSFKQCKGQLLPYFLLSSLTSYNAMTSAFGDSRLFFPKSKCINVNGNRVILNVRTNKLENSHTR